jgi:NAD-dependent dihydropyrimidine dehydrogenase PreA subunit
MSKQWYPVINYVDCSECGACIKNCSHGVYDIEKAPTPVVVSGDGCIEGCHGCGNLCPSGAITYIGDDTGWTPPNGEDKKSDSCDCGCSCGEKAGGCC